MVRFAEAEYILVVFSPTGEDYVRSGKSISKADKYGKEVQGVFEAAGSWTGNIFKNAFVLLTAQGKRSENICATEVLLLIWAGTDGL